MDNSVNREIELKFRIKGWTLDSLYKDIIGQSFINLNKALSTCETRDFYFPCPTGFQMLRLRDSIGTDELGFSKQLQEFTVKRKDTGSNFNRLETNVRLYDVKPMYETLELLFGEPTTTLHKDERVIFTEDKMVISLAIVEDETDIFLEIEGPSEDSVNKYVRLFEIWYDMYPELNSLIEIFGVQNV